MQIRRPDRRPVTRGFALAAASCLLLMLGAMSSSAVEDPDHPGLPRPPGVGAWIVPKATGATYVARSLQWARVPDIQSIAYSRQVQTREDLACRRLDPYIRIDVYTASLFIVSPPGAPAPYGHHGPFTVRTVAFGSIPVEARVRLSQPRDADDLPIGIDAQQESKRFCEGKGPNAGRTEIEGSIENTTAVGQIEVEVLSLVIDGVDVGLRGGCRTPATDLKLTARDFFYLGDHAPGDDPTLEENFYSTPYMSFSQGGLLTGEIDIPPFAGCLAATGEDLSVLLTTTVSGPGNQVRLRSQALANSTEGNTCWDTHTCVPLHPEPFPTSAP